MRARRCRSLLRQAAAALLLAAPLSAVSAYQQPFQPIETAAANILLPRQGSGCLSDFYSCADQGGAFSNTCCRNGQVCRLDADNNPACCPSNAVCTGTAPSTFIPPESVSYVPNTYFSFPYAPTSFPGPAACSSAVRQCSHNLDSCNTQLAGGGGGGGGGNGGVTIVVPGGGGSFSTITNHGGGGAAAAVGTASASSICSSLSSVACRGLGMDMCESRDRPTTVGGFVFGTGEAKNDAAGAGGKPRGVGVLGIAGVVGFIAGFGLGL